MSVKAISLAKWPLELCVILRPRPVCGPPRQIKWFVGLQAVSLAFPWWHWSWCGTHLGREGLLHFITVRIRASVLLVILAIQAFLIWKVWMGKNWARLTLLAWFFFGLRILGPAPLGLSRFTSRRALRLSASCCRPCERFHL